MAGRELRSEYLAETEADPVARVGENLRRLRENRGWTQSELAKRLGTNRANVHKWESGKQCMTLYSAVKIADVLGVSLDVLAGRL